MFQIKLFLIVCTCTTSALSFIDSSTNGIAGNIFNQFVNPTESYVGPSSYATSFQANNHDYPSIGDFGYLMNMKNPQITSSFTSYGPSDSSDFSSTSYINYPSTKVQEIHQNTNPQSISSSYSAHISHDSQQPLPNLNSLINSNSNEEVPISQHIEVTRPIVVPVYKKFPYAVSKDFAVAIPHPVLVPIPAPYPVNVLVAEPVAVPIIKEIKIPVEREVMYPVEKNVPVKVEKPVEFYVEKHYPVYVNKPYPVKIPVIKTVIHKAPKKWSREEDEDEIEQVKRSEKQRLLKKEAHRNEKYRLAKYSSNKDQKQFTLKSKNIKL